ncbi:MAG: S-methyl-5'-thioinosine phosphorylase [Gammaproteobacteria bacterium]|nr:S-methyl-5'-thioinosine phosphorylase [Nitrosospira sp.]MDN5863594.1 S-methyl-5'-thioinosine phosphorylase [Gammaproteobacteria bacterium]
MTAIAIIGGTGLTRLEGLEISRREVCYTPYGEPSGPLLHGKLSGREAVFLARHGPSHRIPPQRVNYRANLWALKSIGVQAIVAVSTVGGIRADMAPGRIVIPDQIVDYTSGRDNTFFNDQSVVHVEFTEPYDAGLRARLLAAGREAVVELLDGGVYAAMQGPRLETAAEINRLETDGCDMVGMTGMPEAVLARELELPYAVCAVVLNRAAGRGGGDIHTEITQSLARGIEQVRDLLRALLPILAENQDGPE